MGGHLIAWCLTVGISRLDIVDIVIAESFMYNKRPSLNTTKGYATPDEICNICKVINGGHIFV